MSAEAMEGPAVESPAPVPSAKPPQVERLELSQEDKLRLGEQAKNLVGNNMTVYGAFSTLIASRQLYSAGRLYLKEALEAAKADSRLYDYLVECAYDAGNQPSTLIDLLDRLDKVVLPTMAGYQREIVARTQGKRQGLAEQQERERRSRPIPVGLKFETGQEPHLTRDRSLLYVGQPQAVRWCLAQAAKAILDEPADSPLYFLHFLHSSDTKFAQPGPSAPYVAVPSKEWAGLADSRADCESTLRRVKPTRVARVDVLLVEDLLRARTGRATYDRHSAPGLRAMINECHKPLKTLAVVEGAALIAGVPTGVSIDFSQPQWNALREFAHLAFVDLAPRKARGDNFSIVCNDRIIGYLTPREWKRLEAASELEELFSLGRKMPG